MSAAFPLWEKGRAFFRRTDRGGFPQGGPPGPPRPRGERWPLPLDPQASRGGPRPARGLAVHPTWL